MNTVSHVNYHLGIPHRSISVSHISPSLASHPESNSQGCSTHFKIARRESSKETEWLLRLLTSSICISSERWYGMTICEADVTDGE